MKTPIIFLLLLTTTLPQLVSGQSIELKDNQLEAIGVVMSLQKMDRNNVVRAVKDSTLKGNNESTFVKIKGIDFHDGTIEVKVLSKLLADAPASARGFIGVAFRINSDNSKFECIYIRPTNGRADDQVRRNHSVQYVSHPDYKFDRLRKEAPEKYESYADMGLNEWIKIKIIVSGLQAKLYLNDNKEPSLLVNDLKLGADQSGGVGLFVENGTEGFFSDLKITK
jgi:hypothetical protein